jgi:hypothetical protein
MEDKELSLPSGPRNTAAVGGGRLCLIKYQFKMDPLRKYLSPLGPEGVCQGQCPLLKNVIMSSPSFQMVNGCVCRWGALWSLCPKIRPPLSLVSLSLRLSHLLGLANRDVGAKAGSEGLKRCDCSPLSTRHNVPFLCCYSLPPLSFGRAAFDQKAADTL